MKQQAHIIDFEREKSQLRKDMSDLASDSLDESEKRLQESLSSMSDLSDSIRSQSITSEDTKKSKSTEKDSKENSLFSLDFDDQPSSFTSDVAVHEKPLRARSYHSASAQRTAEQPAFHAQMSEEEIRAIARKRLQERQDRLQGRLQKDVHVDDAYADDQASETSGVSQAIDRGRDNVTKFRKKVRKARADRQFDRMVDASGDSQSQDDDTATPHAAVYEGHMGHNQRKSGRMQNDRWDKKRNERFDKFDHFISCHSSHAYVAGFVAVCLVVAMVLVYQPMKQYYVAMRTQQQVQAQYDAQQAHSDALQGEVDRLQTDEGVEDRAREQYGMVKNGENAVRVEGDGADQEDATQQSTNANTSASIEQRSHVSAPDTWYSGFLDPFFGYEDN